MVTSGIWAGAHLVFPDVAFGVTTGSLIFLSLVRFCIKAIHSSGHHVDWLVCIPACVQMSQLLPARGWPVVCSPSGLVLTLQVPLMTQVDQRQPFFPMGFSAFWNTRADFILMLGGQNAGASVSFEFAYQPIVDVHCTVFTHGRWCAAPGARGAASVLAWVN